MKCKNGWKVLESKAPSPALCVHYMELQARTVEEPDTSLYFVGPVVRCGKGAIDRPIDSQVEG